MKQFGLILLIAAGCAVGIGATTPSAQAGLFGSGKKSTPTPSPSPSALPTASPEPPSIAIPRLVAKLKANPTDQVAMAQLASEYLQVDRPDITLQYTQHLLQMGDKTAQVYYYDGFAEEQLGNAVAATYDLEQASNLDPTNFGVLAQLADVYIRTNRPNDAERIAKRAVTFNKTEPQAYMTLGSVYAAEQHFDDARAQFEIAYDMNKKDTTALFQIATTYAQQNNIPMALQTIARALAIDPRNIQALVFKADLYAKQHDDAHATEAYDDAVVAAPTDDEKVAIMVRKAGYFVQEKKDAQGVAIFQQMVDAVPEGARRASSPTATTRGTATVRAGGRAVASRAGPRSQQLRRAARHGRGGDAGGPAERQHQLFQALHAGLARRAGLRAPRAGVFARARLFGSARRVRQELRDSALLRRRWAASRGQTSSCAITKKRRKSSTRSTRRAQGFLDQNPQLLYIAAKSYAGSNQCSKAAAAYKRLLPMMKKGTKDYDTVRKGASNGVLTRRQSTRLKRLKFVTDPLYGEHLRGVAHPERPDRVEVVGARLAARGVLADALPRATQPTRRSSACTLAVTSSSSSAKLRLRDGARYLSTGDTVVDATSYRAARRAAGGAIAAVEACRRAARPSSRSCVRRGITPSPIAAWVSACSTTSRSRRAPTRRRPEMRGAFLIVDFDYHHGNGTEAVAGNGLSYLSTHAYPAYPGTGARSYRRGRRPRASTFRCRLRGIATEAFVALWEQLLPAVARAVRPDAD